MRSHTVVAQRVADGADLVLRQGHKGGEHEDHLGGGPSGALLCHRNGRELEETGLAAPSRERSEHVVTSCEALDKRALARAVTVVAEQGQGPSRTVHGKHPGPVEEVGMVDRLFTFFPCESAEK